MTLFGLMCLGNLVGATSLAIDGVTLKCLQLLSLYVSTNYLLASLKLPGTRVLASNCSAVHRSLKYLVVEVSNGQSPLSARPWEKAT